jgi:hypothetical protein
MTVIKQSRFFWKNGIPYSDHLFTETMHLKLIRNLRGRGVIMVLLPWSARQKHHNFPSTTTIPPFPIKKPLGPRSMLGGPNGFFIGNGG